MKKFIVDLLKNEAYDELKLMEAEEKIIILSIEDIEKKREDLLSEISKYTYDSIIKQVKAGNN